MINKRLGTNSTAGTDYNSSPLTKHVREARGNNDDFTGVNYATFFIEYQGKNYHVTESSGTYHSEKHCWLKLCTSIPLFQQLAVKDWKAGSYGGTLTPTQLYAAAKTRITHVYTERDACSGCSPLLEEVLPDDAVVWWSFPYPSKDTKKFEQPLEQVALFSLLTFGPNLINNTTYEQTVNNTVREGRVVGNKQLKTAVKDMDLDDV